MSDEILQEVLDRLDQLGRLVGDGATEGWQILVLQQRLYGFAWLSAALVVLFLAGWAAREATRWHQSVMSDLSQVSNQVDEAMQKELDTRINRSIVMAEETLARNLTSVARRQGKGDEKEAEVFLTEAKRNIRSIARSLHEARDRASWGHDSDVKRIVRRVSDGLPSAFAMRVSALVAGAVIGLPMLWSGILRVSNPEYYALRQILKVVS